MVGVCAKAREGAVFIIFPHSLKKYFLNCCLLFNLNTNKGQDYLFNLSNTVV